MTSLRTKLIALSFAVIAAAIVQAQTAAPASQPSPLDKFLDEAKNPVDWLSWGADFRARNEYFNNIVTLRDDVPRHEQDVFRYRGRIWTSITPVTGLSLNTRLSAEPRQWMRPSFVRAHFDRTGMEWRYGIFDSLNVKWTNAFNQPLTITVGRQDIALGEFYNWWLVADGTPADGSWSFFLDSARLTYDAADLKTKFDLIYIYQTARTDEWMPTIGSSRDYTLTEQNEQGVIFYASNKSLKNAQVDGYYIYKRDEQEFPNIGSNADIHTFGGKVSGTPFEHWRYSVEGAYQFGERQDPAVQRPINVGNQWRDIDAFGANARLSYLFKDSLNNQLHLTYEFLSGDNPDTPGRDEMFDVLWGRWPRFSEAYIYSYIPETGGRVAQLNNIQRFGFGWSLNPIQNMTFSAAYNAWFAPEEMPTRATSVPGATASPFSGSGDFRGHYLQAVLRHQFSKRLSAHLWSELIWPGDFYARRDMMSFLRAEVMFAF
jgi:hypothetical protein